MITFLVTDVFHRGRANLPRQAIGPGWDPDPYHTPSGSAHRWGDQDESSFKSDDNIPSLNRSTNKQ